MPRCSSPDCHRPYYAKGWCNLHWQRVRATGSPEPARKAKGLSETERFWRNVNKDGPNGCWVYGSGTTYGRFQLSGRGSPQVGAHCYSFELHNGPIPAGLFVLHECDNPACVNPEHLSVGDQRRNIRDMVRRGRQGDYERTTPHCPGEKNGHAKLTDEAVRFIRRNPQISSTALGETFGCSRRAVRAARNRETWRHVT